MKCFNIRFFTASLIGLIFSFSFVFTAFGQESDLLTGTGVAISIPVVDEDVQDGDIIASTEQGYKLATYAYQPSIYGVITDTPAVFLKNGDANLQNTRPVLISGKAYVRVSSINGAIKKN